MNIHYPQASSHWQSSWLLLYSDVTLFIQFSTQTDRRTDKLAVWCVTVESLERDIET